MTFFNPTYFWGLLGGDNSPDGTGILAEDSIDSMPLTGQNFGCPGPVADDFGACLGGDVVDIGLNTTSGADMVIDGIYQDPSNYPDDTTVYGPGFEDIAPPPDYALIGFGYGATNYWGYHGTPDGGAACCLSDGTECGPYQFWSPKLLVQINAGTLRKLREWTPDGDITIYGPTPTSGPNGSQNWASDPLVEGDLEVPSGVRTLTTINCPVPDGTSIVDYLNGADGWVAPPTPAYVPDPDVSLEQSLDAQNLATYLLWPWEDALEFVAIFDYGDRKPYSLIQWDSSSAGANTSGTGVHRAGIGLRPFWLMTPDETGAGVIAAGAVGRGVRRRGRIVGRAVNPD